MSAGVWSELCNGWQAGSLGGWLVVTRRGRERFATPWRDVDDLCFTPSTPNRPGQLRIVLPGDLRFDFPTLELAAQRVRHWWHEASALRTAVPQWADLGRLVTRPEEHGGRRWISRLLLATSPDGGCALGGFREDGRPLASQAMAFRPSSPAVKDYLDSHAADFVDGQWSYHRGIAIHTFDWCRNRKPGRTMPMIGVLSIEQFRADSLRRPEEAPVVPFGRPGAM